MQTSNNLRSFGLISLFTLFLLGCASSASENEKETLIKNRQLIELDEVEKLRLTYHFQNSMTKDELTDFYNYINSEEVVKTINLELDKGLDYSIDIADNALLYSNYWNKAYATGDLTNALGLVALAGFGIAALTPDRAPIHTSSYYVPESITKGLSALEVTKISRQKTLNEIKTFFTSIGYELICEEGCNKEFKANENTDYKLWLGLKNPELEVKYFRPTALKIQLKLLPLINNKVDDSLLLGGSSSHKTPDKFGWQIILKGPNTYAGEVEKHGYKYLGLFSDLHGTMLHRKLFEHLTKEMSGYSYVYRGRYNIHYHVKEAYYNGNTYELHDEVTNNSLIKGRIKS